MTEFKTRLDSYCDLINTEIDKRLSLSGLPQQIVADAMKYSISAGGKRIRPVLTLEFCRLFGGEVEKALPFACAVEMIHTYSLIHDDLPCMDNDDMRRGRPSCHIAFGEANALLAGDGLLTLAFGTAASAELDDKKIRLACLALSEYAGMLGMIGGQVIDLASEGKSISPDTLIEMYTLKTGALLRLSSRLGCIAAGAGSESEKLADDFSYNLGLAFQITDDILDVTGTEADLGKPIGSDSVNEKSTYVTLFGPEKAVQEAERLTKLSRDALDKLNSDTSFLNDLLDMLLSRRN